MSDQGGGDATDPRRDLAGVLHDVSNELTVLLGWLAEARADALTEEKRKHALTMVEQRARTARDLARQAIGGEAVDEPQAIGDVARDVIESLTLAASEAGATIRGAGGATAEVAGALALANVIKNVVINAVAHAPSGSEVTVDVTADDERVSIVVTDQGPGVPDAQRERIFLGASFRPGGTGVGLRHSREVARAAGGDLELLPAVAGKGASFRVSWPRVDAVLPRATGSSRAREFAGVRVLLVEDDMAVRQLLETALEARGAEVTVAATATEFDRAVEKSSYEVALLDLSPIAADAAGAIAGLRRSSPGVDLVLISGSVDKLPDAIAADTLKLVRKPFEVAELLAALKKRQ